MEMGGQRKIGRPKQRWRDVIRNEGEMSKDRTGTCQENAEKENSMCLTDILRRPKRRKKKKTYSHANVTHKNCRVDM